MGFTPWVATVGNIVPPLPVADGGTGDTALTAFALLAGGTTTTAAVQSLGGVGTAGQALTSAGAGALPSFGTLPIAGGGTGATTAAAGLAALGGLVKQADTGPNGFTMINGTQTILTYTTANDGLLHTVIVNLGVLVTVLQVGGALQLAWTDPAGNARTSTLNSGGLGTGMTNVALAERVVQANTTVTLSQSSALTAGASVAYAQLWGN